MEKFYSFCRTHFSIIIYVLLFSVNLELAKFKRKSSNFRVFSETKALTQANFVLPFRRIFIRWIGSTSIRGTPCTSPDKFPSVGLPLPSRVHCRSPLIVTYRPINLERRKIYRGSRLLRTFQLTIARDKLASWYKQSDKQDDNNWRVITRLPIFIRNSKGTVKKYNCQLAEKSLNC